MSSSSEGRDSGGGAGSAMSSSSEGRGGGGGGGSAMSSAERELEEALVKIGARLRSPPDADEALLVLLNEADNCLARVDQLPSPSILAALCPVKEALVAKNLMGHSNREVKVAVTSCVSEITRITALEAPYDDDRMKVIFQMIVETFGTIDDLSSRSSLQRLLILETVAKVRSCMVMLDLECGALILDMFNFFLRNIRPDHPDKVFSSMELIMTLVLEESEYISAELISCLMNSVKMDNKEVLPVGRRLGEKVISNCAMKLMPFLVQAQSSLISVALEQNETDSTGDVLVGDKKLSERPVSDDLPEGSDPTFEEKGSVLDDQNQDDLLSKDISIKKEPEATGRKKRSETAHEVERTLSSDPEAKSAPKQKSNVKQTMGDFTLDKVAIGESSLKRSWAHLPSDLIVTILEKLQDSPEWDCFGAVCRHWRQIILNNKSRYVSVCNDRRVMLLQKFASEKFLKFRLQSEEPPKIIGYSFGYLITMSKGLINLCDALFGSFIRVQETENAPDFVLRKAILSCDATEAACILMGIVQSDTRRLAFCDVQEGKWKSLYNPTVDGGGYGYDDLTYHNGKCYCVTENGAVHMCELGVNPMIRVLAPSPRLRDVDYRRSIVPMGDNVIVVLRDSLPVECDSSGGFAIEELDLASHDWRAISDLEGWQVFVGISSFALPPERQSKFGKPNGVYILQDEYEIERSANAEVCYYEGTVDPTISDRQLVFDLQPRQLVFDVQQRRILAQGSALGAVQVFWFYI